MAKQKPDTLQEIVNQGLYGATQSANNEMQWHLRQSNLYGDDVLRSVDYGMPLFAPGVTVGPRIKGTPALTPSEFPLDKQRQMAMSNPNFAPFTDVAAFRQASKIYSGIDSAGIGAVSNAGAIARANAAGALNDLGVGLGASQAMAALPPSAGGMLADNLPSASVSASNPLPQVQQPVNAATRWTANAQAAKADRADTNGMLYGSVGSGETIGVSRNPATKEHLEMEQERWRRQKALGMTSYLSPEQEMLMEQRNAARRQAANPSGGQPQYDLNRASWSQGGKVGGRQQFAADNNLTGRQYRRMFGKISLAPRNNHRMDE